MKWIIRAAILPLWFAWLALLSHAAAEGLPHAKPEEVGLSSERLGRLTQMLRTNIAAGEIPGAVLLIARHGKIAYFESLGLDAAGEHFFAGAKQRDGGGAKQGNFCSSDEANGNEKREQTLCKPRIIIIRTIAQNGHPRPSDHG